jgi:hypothetical protein
MPPMSEVVTEAAEKLRHEAERARYRETDVKAKPVYEPAHERTMADLERVPDPAPQLVEALWRYLQRNPRRAAEGPSWLTVVLWAEDHVEDKPTPEDVEVALAEVERETLGAA